MVKKIMKFGKPIIIFLLIILWLGTGFSKVRLYQKGTGFKTEGDFCLFRVEEALRYHYAKLVSQGGEIPRTDIRVQYPEGLAVTNHIPLTSEIFIGKLYKLLPFKTVSFHIFLVYFMFFFSSLNVFAIYLFARSFCHNLWAPFAAVIFYVTAFPSFARTITGGLVEEDFALFFIFMSYWFFLMSIEEDRFFLSVPAGLCLFVPLSSWHGTQFCFLLLLVYIVFEFFIRPEKCFATETRKTRIKKLLGLKDLKTLATEDTELHKGKSILATEDTERHGDNRIRNVKYFLLFRGGGCYKRENLVKSFAVVVGFNIAAGLIFPVLRTEYFVFSYAMLISYALILTWCVEKVATRGSVIMSLRALAKQSHNEIASVSPFPRNDKKRLFRWIRFPLFLGICVLLLLMVTPLVRQHSEDYGHIYALIINKIRYLGKKPLFSKTVEQLSFDTKIMWQSSNVSPSLGHIKSNFGWLFLAGAVGLGMTLGQFFRRRLSFLEEGVLYFVVVFFIYYLLIRRMYIFEVFFLPLFVSKSITIIRRKKGVNSLFCQKRELTPFLTGAIFAFLGCCWFFQAKQTRASISGVARRIPGIRQDVIKWIRNNTPDNAVILADIGISPEIITFGRRKSVLHNFFETTEIRRKTEEFYRALFKKEKNFWQYCQKYGADYVVYNWNFLLNVSADSIRYQVDTYYVHRNEICYLFNFEPEKLKYFTLLWQSNHYRIYGVNEKMKIPQIPRLEYVPFFNKKLFVEPKKEIWIEGDEQGPIFDDDYAQERMQKVWAMPKVLGQAQQYRQQQKYEQALAAYKKNVEADPYMPQARLSLGEFFLSLARYEEAAGQLRQAIELDPNLGQAYYFLGIAYANSGQKEKAIDILTRGLKLDPENEFMKKALADARSL